MAELSRMFALQTISVVTLLPARLLQGLLAITRSKPTILLIYASILSGASVCTSVLSIEVSG
jgi:hypothetical protein